MLLNNVKIDNFLGETLAYNAFNHMRTSQYLSTQAIVGALLYATQQLGSVIAKADSQPSQDLLKPVYSLKEAIFPEFADAKDAKAERIKELMQQIQDEGPIRIKPVGVGQKGS